VVALEVEVQVLLVMLEVVAELVDLEKVKLLNVLIHQAL
tara:strand:+ start:164 stop:280 length:117 start_codon:yes stop_codon:yes gene_type:complete